MIWALLYAAIVGVVLAVLADWRQESIEEGGPPTPWWLYVVGLVIALTWPIWTTIGLLVDDRPTRHGGPRSIS